MKNLSQWDINQLLEKTNSPEATPGGGSISAISAALGAGLIGMMAKLSIGKTACPEQEQIRKISEKVDALLEELVLEAGEDIRVFDAVMAAYGAPKVTEIEKQERTEKIQKALKEAALSPLKTGKICLQVLELAVGISKIGNQNAVSDGIAGGLLAEAALQAVLLNVQVNMNLIKDEGWKMEPSKEAERISAEGVKIRQELLKLCQV